MQTIDPQSWKRDLPEFKEKTEAFMPASSIRGLIRAFPVSMEVMRKRGGRRVCCACA